MEEYENSEEVEATATSEDLRTTGWTNSAEVVEDPNAVQEVVEEIVVDQSTEYLSCIDDDFVEDSIVYVFEEPVVEFELNDTNMNSQDEDVDKCEEKETSQCENVNSENEDIPISDNLKFNYNENSDSLDNNVENDSNEDQSSQGEEDDSNVLIGPLLPNQIPDYAPVDDTENEHSSPKIRTPSDTTPTASPSLSKLLTPNSQTSENNISPGLKPLGKEQIKKRLQSFSLLKQGIQPIPIKKIISPKQPKVHTTIEEVYDEIGRKTEEKLILKKPPKQGPTPSEKARQVINEIEQIKKEEQEIYEQTLLFMKHSMRDAHHRRSKYYKKRDRGDRERSRTKSPVVIRRERKYENKEPPKRPRKISEDDKFRKISEDDKFRKSLENDRRKSPEIVKFEKKKIEKEPEREEMPRTWSEVKKKYVDFSRIKRIKERIFKFTQAPFSPDRKKKKKNKNNVQNVNTQQEVRTTMKREDFCKPQLMFEFPSALRTTLVALDKNGQSKYYPSELIRFTEKLPEVSFCENPQNSTVLFRNRKQVLSEVPEERAEIMMKIIENKLESIKPGKYIEGVWYPSTDYLEESKNPIESVSSYGLSVLSEMYDDEPEEIQEPAEIKEDKEGKSKKEKKKSKKKHKKHKSKSRSSSEERTRKEKKAKKKEKKKNKKEKTKPEEEIPKEESEPEPKKKDEDGDSTPNTEEYRSNWESDEEFLDIIPKDGRSFDRRNLDKDWEIEEPLEHDKSFEEKDHGRKSRNSDERKKDKYNFEQEERISSKRSSREDNYEYSLNRIEERSYEKREKEDFRRSSSRQNKSEERTRHLESKSEPDKHKKQKEDDKKHSSEKKNYKEETRKPKQEPEEKKIKEEPKKLEEKSRHSIEPEIKPERKSSKERKHDVKEEKKEEKKAYHKWSSDEDLHKSYKEKHKPEPQNIELNLNLKYQKSQWSSDEEYIKGKDKYELVRQIERRRNYEEPIYQKYESLLDGNLINLLDLDRNRKLVEEKTEEKYKKDHKKERKEDKSKKNKKKSREKKDNKKPKVHLSYTEDEESYDEDFKTAKQKNLEVQNAKKYAAKIKIDYSDFDLSLSESKDKYNKKFEGSCNPSPEKITDTPLTPRERKVNIDLSEILEPKPEIKLQSPESKIIALETITIETPPKTEIVEIGDSPERTPVSKTILDEYPKSRTLEVEGVTPITPKTPVMTQIEISPVAPPVLPIPNPVIDLPVTPVVQDPSKLVSEYEEFMKAVSFDEPKDEIKIPDEEKSENQESSAEESSSEYESSELESSSEAESTDSETRRNKMLEKIANIKTEKVTDSENESQDAKRKREESIEKELVVVKIEKEVKKKKVDPTFECETKYDNIIDWENTEITNNKSIIDICLLPENIPLPNENLETVPVPEIPQQQIQSPKETICISSDNSTPSPVKKSRSIIPIKLLTAESRKQANETANVLPLDHSPGFGVFAQKDVLPQPTEPQEDITDLESRKRQSQWHLNITPAKKPLLQSSALPQDDSDEDFTEKFIKTDKKPETPKKEEQEKDKLEVKEKMEVKEKLEIAKMEVKEPEKVELVQEKKPEPKKPKEEEVQKKIEKPVEKPKHHSPHRDDHRPRRSPPKPDPRAPRRCSRDRYDRRDKPPHSPDRKRDRPRDFRDRERESIRDREKRRPSDRRPPERKPGPPRGRSPRNKYSREREMRGRPRDRSRERPRPDDNRSRERERSRERIRERSREREHRERVERFRRDERRFSRSPSPHRKPENIPVHHRPDDTDFSTTSMDIVQSPVNSPLDGFKRSLADSTISDSELITQLNTPDESNEPSPAYSHLQYYPSVQDAEPRDSPSSPKRISLDDRINLVLGIEKEPPKQIDTVCTRGSYNHPPPNYDPYGYNRTEYDVYNTHPHPDGYVPPYNQYQNQYYPPPNPDNSVKVLQVGNVIQVVPTEHPPPVQPPAPKPEQPKVVQVGNMLQIVPVTIIEPTVTTVTSPVATVVQPVEKPVIVSPPKMTEQIAAERRAEKEKRRLEREARRKEKERKRKEKEKRKQLKIKTKTENMIKRALMLETGEGDLDISNIDTEPTPETSDNNNLPVSWPPASSLLQVPLPKPPSKGILVTHGFREKDESFEDSMENRKVVKFADGICPGEGTSPSAGEDLPSPPPPPRKLPKEKRYKKVKNKNKKKIKVKIIRTQQQPADDDSSSEDNLPPPPPPPGSPPPHLWPPRIKQPPVNNIHPQVLFPTPPPQVLYPPAFPPMGPMAHAPPPPNRQHHPPVMPVLQTGAPPPPPHHGAHQTSFHH